MYPKILFSKCGWYYFTLELFLRAAFRALEIREVELSPILRKKKKWQRYRPKIESGTSQGVSKFVKPTDELEKKQSGKRSLSLAVPQVELLSEFYEKRNIDRYWWFSAQWSILSWFWPDFVLRLGWPSVTYLILVQKSRFFFPSTSCSLSPGDHDRSRFSVQFGVVLKL